MKIDKLLGFKVGPMLGMKAALKRRRTPAVRKGLCPGVSVLSRYVLKRLLGKGSFVEVQSLLQRVSREKWSSMEKIIYFPAREEVQNGEPYKCKVTLNEANFSTSTMITSVHLRMVKPY